MSTPIELENTSKVESAVEAIALNTPASTSPTSHGFKYVVAKTGMDCSGSAISGISTLATMPNNVVDIQTAYKKPRYIHLADLVSSGFFPENNRVSMWGELRPKPKPAKAKPKMYPIKLTVENPDTGFSNPGSMDLNPANT